MRSEEPGPAIGRKPALVVCGALTLLFAVLAYTAVLGKSPTYDEPYHLVGAYMRSAQGDYRFNVEDPALFAHFAALRLEDDALKIPFPGRAEAAKPRELLNADLDEEQMFREFPGNIYYQWVLAARAVFQTPGVDADALIDRARLPFTLLGALLVAVLAWWAWGLAGSAAAVAAAALVALDPNFLGHAPLLKNDVPITLLMVAMMFALWRIGRSVTVANSVALIAIFAAAFNFKYSGVLLVPILAATLLARSLLPLAWPAFGRSLAKRWQRLALSLALGCMTAVGTAAVTWACYDFRFAPSSNPELRLDTAEVGERAVIRLKNIRAFELERAGRPREEVLASVKEPLATPTPVRLALWLEEMRLLPQAWINGFVYTYQSSLTRRSFLMGEHSTVGWRSYFPLAMSFKTPMATWAAIVFLPLLVLVLRLRRGWRPTWEQGWAISCVGLAPLVYGANAIMTNLNLGLRHVLPIYPFLFVAGAVSFAWLLSVFRGARWIGGGLVALLAIETLVAYPDYLAFFNAPSGGARGGFHLLSDSNLDWGQDLKGLAEWREQNRGKPLYISYFGTADPRYYIPDAIILPGGLVGDATKPPEGIRSDSFLAVSASCLQGTYTQGGFLDSLKRVCLPGREVALIGGSIYVFLMPAQPPDRTR
jgi:hypothetical protein